MADRRRPPLTLPLAAVGMLGALWFAVARLPAVLARPAADPTGPVAADLMAARGLFPGGLPDGFELVELRVEDGVWNAVLQTDLSAPVEELRPLVRRARSAGWEAHATPVGTTGAELRLYGDDGLRMLAVVLPRPRALRRAEPAATLRERPLIAIVVNNLGERDAGALLNTPFPLGLAVQPYAPHSLRIARGAVRAGHEVLLELPRAESTTADDRSAALAAVPWASGVLVVGATPASLPPLPFGVLVSGLAGIERGDVAGYAAVPAVIAGQPLVGLAEAQRRCGAEGAAVVVIDAQHGELRAVLDWAAHRAEADGYRLALPSEVARAEEVAGQHTEPARAGGGEARRPPPPRPIAAAPEAPVEAKRPAGLEAREGPRPPVRDLGALELE